MILSSRIFLVLLLPLLVHGTSTSEWHGLPDVGPTPLLSTYELPKTLKSPEKFQLSPSEPDLRPFGGTSPRSIIVGNPWLWHLKTIDVRDSDLDEDACVLPPDTRFRMNGHTTLVRERGDRYPIPARQAQALQPPPGSLYITITEDVVAITRDGAIVLLPRVPGKPTRVRLSLDDIICLPALNSQARVIYHDDQKEIENWCKEIYAHLLSDHRLFDLNVRRCVWVNYKNVGRDKKPSQFVHVPALYKNRESV